MTQYVVVDQRGSFYAVGHNGLGGVLVQMGDLDGTRARVALTPEQAEEMAAALARAAKEV